MNNCVASARAIRFVRIFAVLARAPQLSRMELVGTRFTGKYASAYLMCACACVGVSNPHLTLNFQFCAVSGLCEEEEAMRPYYFSKPFLLSYYFEACLLLVWPRVTKSMEGIW